MKFTVSDEQREYFYENRMIEFEGLLSEEEVSTLFKAIESVISKKEYRSGRDVWRGSEVIQKYATLRLLGQISSQLVDDKPLRLGLDQVMRSKEYRDRKPLSLKESVSVQPISCAALLRLSEVSADSEQEFLLHPGSVLFLHPNCVIDPAQFFESSSDCYYLIVYCPAKCRYVINRNDPQSSSLMQQGYNSGDRLNDSHNPIIYR